MNYKTFLSDQFFLSGLRLYLLGCVSNSMTALIFLVSIWVLSDSFNTFFTTIQAEMRHTISISMYLTIILNLALLLTLIPYYFSLSAITKEFKAFRGEGAETLAKYTISFFAFILVTVVFLIGYFIQRESWDAALRISLLTIFPFPIAFMTSFLVGMVMETTLVTLSYIIHRNRQ